MIPASRNHVVNDRQIRAERRYVVYWMTSARRLEYNFALEHAVQRARELGRPLIVFEALRCGYEHANDRLHAFVLQGMAEHAAALKKTAVTYYPYVEPAAGAGSGLLAALARDACLVVADWSPAFFLPRMLASAARQIDVRVEAIDSNGILPVADAGRAIPMAHGFRAHLQRSLRAQLKAWPAAAPLDELPKRRRAAISADVLARWPPADRNMLAGRALDRLPIDHGVAPVSIRGGAVPARARVKAFVSSALDRYAADRNQPEQIATSRLSPWLHFGHLSVHEVFERVMSRERWTSRKLGSSARGAREGWWQVSASAESFLDELITWRELAFNTAAFMADYTDYTSLPEWSRRTLGAHRRDRRPHRYTLAQFEAARTHDPLWNAAQGQLKQEGWFHGYMRMLWGKKILEWSAAPQAALDTMATLMNRYSLDGRGPNAWAGFMWVLGRYDRPWPERDIFGAVRYMSSASAARKLRTTQYVAAFGSRLTTLSGNGTGNRGR
jgi:deoxyribodipyrimidine photo-lyase